MWQSIKVYVFVTVRRITTTTAPQRHLQLLTFNEVDFFFILYIWWDLTCERQQSTHGRPTCDCQKGTRCLLPYTARTQILWPDNATQTHTKQESKPGGSRELMWWIQQKKLHVMKVFIEDVFFFFFFDELTSQSSLMCLANVVWISVREQLSLPLEMSIRSWSEYMSSFSTKCCRSWSCGKKTHTEVNSIKICSQHLIKYWFGQQQFFSACTGSCFVCWETFSTIKQISIHLNKRWSSIWANNKLYKHGIQCFLLTAYNIDQQDLYKCIWTLFITRLSCCSIVLLGHKSY